MGRNREDPGSAHPSPPGWTHNPSAWRRRRPILIRAAIGLIVATYLGLYQLGIVSSVWDPFFGSESTEAILGSAVATLLPVPDALVGAAAYLMDIITGLIGGSDRWRTKPWIVILFGIVVVPVGTTATALVILQPELFHHWCTLCLLSAFMSVSLVGPVLTEVLASLQYLTRARHRGGSVWRTFLGRSAGVGISGSPAGAG